MLNKNALIIYLLCLPISLLIALRGATPGTKIYWDIYKNIELYDILKPSLFYNKTEIAFGWYSHLITQLLSKKLFFFFIYSYLIFFSFQIYERLIIKIKSKRLIALALITLSIIVIKLIIMPTLINLSGRIASYTAIAKYSYSRNFLALPNMRTTLILFTAYILTSKKLYQNKTYRFLFFA